jgi:hypothetical protein
MAKILQVKSRFRLATGPRPNGCEIAIAEQQCHSAFDVGCATVVIDIDLSFVPLKGTLHNYHTSLKNQEPIS